ncbi:MAG: alpha/beta fold hydrolase [Chitinophagales bacterium]|nr:alpha/beta fold hydrolase [Bacteroidota bacterium]
MKLNYKVSGSGEPLIILHGLFGMLDNWQTVGKNLEKYFTVYLIDQRNHGRSPHDDLHSYSAMADDLNEFLIQTGISSANILGHSMGGKTAMQFALTYPKEIKKLIVVDIGIKKYPGGHEEIMDALLSIDLKTVHYRADAEKILLNKIPNFSVRQFLLKSLQRNSGGSYSWKFNLDALYNNYEENILTEIKATHVFSGETLFISGEKSPYILKEDWPKIQLLFPNARWKIIANAGHWVHAEQPDLLIDEIVKFIND